METLGNHMPKSGKLKKFAEIRRLKNTWKNTGRRRKTQQTLGRIRKVMETNPEKLPKALLNLINHQS